MCVCGIHVIMQMNDINNITKLKVYQMVPT